MQAHSLRSLTATTCPWLLKRRSSFCVASLSFSQQDQTKPDKTNCSNGGNSKPSSSYFPKRGQELELVCESLAFKGKGVCKVAYTGFVVMCDRALTGEKLIWRITRKKENYAETISPHSDSVDAPCEYASYYGGCKTQNLSYEAQLSAKEQQVHELMIHVGKFSDKDPEFFRIMKPIVPCDVQFHYRNKMEFSFGSKTWLPKKSFQEKEDREKNYVLGLHAPGFFD